MVRGRRLLWIDDEISSASAEVRFLELEGFSVDCAVTGSHGLALARISRYDGILLDLRLPDLPGLSVLATLKAENIATPVLVLTGFGDFESARVAGRLGVNEFKTKPIFVDDLETAVGRLIQASPLDNCRSVRSDGSGDEPGAGLALFARLLEVLHVLSRELQPDATGTRCGADAKQILVAALIRGLANPALPMWVFMACASALRRVVGSDESQSVTALASDAESVMCDALMRRESQDSRVGRALEMVRAAATQHDRVTIESIAGTERIDAAHLGRLIRTETGFEFIDWRTAFLVRPSLAPLLETREHVKQIARRHLGYKHEAQFDRDFHRFFGLTPTALRQVCRLRE